MGKILAKKPQYRVSAKDKHPTVQKLEKLFDYMDELNLELKLSFDRVYVIDTDRPHDHKWEIIDAIKSKFLTHLPLETKSYKLAQDRDIPPREAQPAPIK